MIIGTGIGGVAAAVLLQNKVPNLTYTVYEKNKGVVSPSLPYFEGYGHPLNVLSGRHMVGKSLPGSALRRAIAFLPIDLCAEFELERVLLRRFGDSKILCKCCTEIWGG